MWATVSNSRFNACAIAGIVALALAAALPSIVGRVVHPLPHGVRSATLALELMRAPIELSDIAVTPQERDRLASAVRLDFGFVIAYGVFFVLLARIATGSGRRALVALGVGLTAAAVGASLFDVLENRAMLQVLAGSALQVPRPSSLAKWSAIFTAFGCSAPVLVDSEARLLRRWIGYLGALASVWSAGVGWSGVALGAETVIEDALRPAAVAAVLGVIFIGTRHVLRDGVLEALNRLAAWPRISAIVQWPDADDNETVGPPIPVDRN